MIVWALLYFCLLLFLCFEYLIIKDSTTSADCWKIAVNCKVIALVAPKRVIFKTHDSCFYEIISMVSKLSYSQWLKNLLKSLIEKWIHIRHLTIWTPFLYKATSCRAAGSPRKNHFFPILEFCIVEKKHLCLVAVHSGCVKVLGKRNAYVRKEWKSFRN